ncbi:unnamed protein product, partial [Ixodes persulcatus]
HSVQLTDEAVRMRLSNMLTGLAENVTVPPILPGLGCSCRYLLVPRKGKVEIVRALDIPGLDTYRRLTLRLRNEAFRNLSSESDWREVTERCTDTYPSLFLREDKKACTHLNLVIFNEKAFPQGLLQITKYGIEGLYTTFAFMIVRLLWRIMADMAFTIMYDDLPNVDRVLQLCLYIYLVRESREISLEEDLFAKLIFRYRSPETLIKWTWLT